MYIDILRSLREVVRRTHHKKLRINIWFLLHDNGPAYSSVLVRDFLEKPLCQH